MSAPPRPLRIAIVGPCTAGKSTLVAKLRSAGRQVRHVAQEHSYVANMWQRLTKPDVLIYLDVEYSAAKSRRPNIDWGPERLAEQSYRLRHARQHCNLYLNTTDLNAAQVHEQVTRFLAGWETSD